MPPPRNYITSEERYEKHRTSLSTHEAKSVKNKILDRQTRSEVSTGREADREAEEALHVPNNAIYNSINQQKK